VLRVPAPPHINLTEFLQTRTRIGPQGLEHAITHRPIDGIVSENHRLRHKVAQRVEHVPVSDPATRDDGLSGDRIEAAGEHAEPIEQLPSPLTRVTFVI
jgi:hypothetical protein